MAAPPFIEQMDPIGSLSNVQTAVAQRVGSSDSDVQQSAQISVLKKANEVQAQSALALISGIGGKLDVHG